MRVLIIRQYSLWLYRRIWGVGFLAMNRVDGRRHDLDALRVMCFGTLIIYHTSLLYGTGDWLLSAEEPNRLIDLIHVGSHPWRMSLLFFISGMVTASLLQKRPVGEIRRSRTRQLLLPFLFGVLVIVPPQAYFASLLVFPDLSLRDFLSHYFTGGFSLQHMWFLGYLWIYVFIWSLGFPRLERHWPNISAALASSLKGWKLLLVPIAFLSVLRIGLYPIFGETLVITTDVYGHTLYFSFFVAGTLLMHQQRFWQDIDRYRWIACGTAVVSLILLCVISMLVPADERPELLAVALRIVRSTFQWCSIIALLAFAGRIVRGPSRVVTYFNRSIMTYYVLHQTIIIIVAYYLAQAGILELWTFVPVIVITALTCGLLAEVKNVASIHLPALFTRLALLKRAAPKPPSPEAAG